MPPIQDASTPSQPAAYPGRPTLGGNVSRMYLFEFLINMHFFAGVLIPFFTDWGGITFTQVMLIQSLFFILISILEVPTGAIADHLGRKASLILGALAIFITPMLYAWEPSFKLFLVAEFFWALAAALISGANQALLYDTLKEMGREQQSKRILARASSCKIIAIMISAPIGSLIAARYGLRMPMLCMTIPFGLAFLLGFTFKEPPVEKREKESYLRVMLGGLRYFFGHDILRKLAFDAISIHILCFMAIWLFQPRLKDIGVPLAVFGFVMSASTGLQALVMNQFETLERWAGSKRRYLVISAVIPGLAYFLLGWTRNHWLAGLSIMLIGGIGLSRNVLLVNYMNKYIESHNRATVLSSVSMVRQFVSALVYPTVGLLAEWSLPGTLMILGAAVLACGAASRVQEAHLLD